MKPFHCLHKPVPLKGTFLSLWLVQDWDDATWDRELTAYTQLGMEYVIFSPGVCVGASGKQTVYYPSACEEFKDGYVGVDVLDSVFRHCEQYHLKCFLGTLQDDACWWTLWWDREKALAHYDWFCDWNRRCNRVAEDVWALYGKKYPNAFYGWYLVPEFWNFDLLKPDAKGRNAIVRMLADGFGIHLDYLTGLTPGKPAMTSPFANLNLGTAEELKAQWCDLLNNIPFRPGDILCPQDSVGAGGTKLSQLDAAMQAYQAAVACRPGMVLWANNEDFEQTTWSSAMMDRFVRQLEITHRYAAVNVTFAYNNYYSPVNVKPCFHEAMLHYEKTGELLCIPPAAPKQLSAERQGTKLLLRWTQKEMEQLVRYEITAKIAGAKKEGILAEQEAVSTQLLGVVHCGFRNNAEQMPELATEFTYEVPEDQKNCSAEITVTAFDVWGTPSPTAKIKVTL